jgi:hypothetical protein
VEVNGSDSASLKRFYGDLFGWPVNDFANGYGLVPAAREGGVSAALATATARVQASGSTLVSSIPTPHCGGSRPPAARR